MNVKNKIIYLGKISCVCRKTSLTVRAGAFTPMANVSVEKRTCTQSSNLEIQGCSWKCWQLHDVIPNAETTLKRLSRTPDTSKV